METSLISLCTWTAEAGGGVVEKKKRLVFWGDVFLKKKPGDLNFEMRFVDTC